MKHKTFEHINCAIAHALDQVGDRWTLLIVRECMFGASEFNEIQQNLEIARNVLADRLSRLVKLEIMRPILLGDPPKRRGYVLTPKREGLLTALVALMHWGDKWIAPHAIPTRLVTSDTGQAVEVAVRAPSGPALSMRQIRFQPGPGAKPASKAAIERRNLGVLGRS